MTLLFLALLALGGGYWYRHWKAHRFSNGWWRDLTRRELQALPENVSWDWDTWKDRKL